MKRQRDLIEDMIQEPGWYNADYIQEAISEPSDLGPVEETEEENIGRELRKFPSLRDLSKDLKKMCCKSDLFEEDKLEFTKIPVISEINAGIKETEQEYEENSDDDKEKTKERIKRTMVLDKTEPLENIFERQILSKKKSALKDLPDPIEEEPISDSINEDFNSNSLIIYSIGQIAKNT